MMERRLQKPPISKNLLDGSSSRSRNDAAPPPTTNNNDPNFDRKLDAITACALPHVKEHLLTKISRENCQTIINYILAMQTEIAPSETYRISTIHALKHFAEFHSSKKPRVTFQEMQRQDVIDFLDSFRKAESVPYHDNREIDSEGSNQEIKS